MNGPATLVLRDGSVAASVFRDDVAAAKWLEEHMSVPPDAEPYYIREEALLWCYKSREDSFHKRNAVAFIVVHCETPC